MVASALQQWHPSRLTAALACVLLAGPAHALPRSNAPFAATLANPIAVFGDDSRRVMTGKRPELSSSIGVLYDSRSGGVCTAFCVARDIVATAAHCLFSTSGEQAPRLADFRFRMRLSDPRGEARIAGSREGMASQNIVAGSTRLSVRPPIDATRDWALVRIERRVCTGHLLPIDPRPTEQLMTLSRVGQIYQVAFHKDFGDWQLVDGGKCTLSRDFESAEWPAIARDFHDSDRLILHTCDTGGASSGSPLLIDGPNGPAVVGINVGTYVQSRVMMQDGVVVHRYAADTIANTAVNALSFQASLAAFRDAGLLATRAQLRELQAALREQGYYAGPLDGQYGPALKAAIEALEREENLPVTGLATAALRTRLGGAAPVATTRPLTTIGRSIETGSIGAKPRANR